MSKKKTVEEKKEALKKGDAMILMDPDVVEYASKPIGKSIMTKASEERKSEKKKARWNDRLECEICGKQYFRSARTAHKRTQYHKIHADLNKKFTKIMLNK